VLVLPVTGGGGLWTGSVNLRALGACLRARGHRRPENRASAAASTLISRQHEQGALPLAARAAGAVLAALAAGAFTLSFPGRHRARASPRLVCPRSSCLHGPVGALDASGLAQPGSLAHGRRSPPRAAGVAECQFAHGSIDRRPLLHAALASCVTLTRPELGRSGQARCSPPPPS
jgi:hypothetical protein